MTEAFQTLRELLGRLDDLERVANLLSWDQETKLPREGAAARAEQRATIERLAHELVAGDELARALDAVGDPPDPETVEGAIVRVARRDHEKARRVPAELRADMTRAGSLGTAAWWEAHARADYELLRPHLERQVELKLRYIDCFEGFADPYDALLDDFEEELTSAEVDVVFAALKRELVPLVRKVAEAPPVVSTTPSTPSPRRPRRATSGSPRGSTSTTSTGSSRACTSSATASTSARWGTSSSGRRSRTAPRRRCTNRRAGCGRTSSAGAVPSGTASTARSRPRSPSSSRGSTGTPSTAASTGSSRR
jgi:carboxypeptidase Taq (M32) metallopeptidase